MRRGHRTLKAVREWLGCGIVPQIDYDDLRSGNYLLVSENGALPVPMRTGRISRCRVDEGGHYPSDRQVRRFQGIWGCSY